MKIESKTIKRNIISIIGIVISIFIIVIIKQTFLIKPSFDSILIKDAEEINKTCPFMVDQTTRLDSANALPDRTFQINYTLINVCRDSMNLIEFEMTMRPVLLEKLKGNQELKEIRGKNVTMVYDFKDINGKSLSKFTFKAKEYEK